MDPGRIFLQGRKDFESSVFAVPARPACTKLQFSARQKDGIAACRNAGFNKTKSEGFGAHPKPGLLTRP